MEYDRAGRKRLGRAVRAARHAAGYANRGDFADKMKRSTRQVQALENGEDGVGPDTWAVAADVLGWDLERVYALLEDRQPEQGELSSAVLTDVSDDELVAEVLRRMRKAGDQGGERDTPAMTLAARRTGRAPSGQQSDEERAAELGLEVVRPAQERARRRDDAGADENSDEGVTGA